MDTISLYVRPGVCQQLLQFGWSEVHHKYAYTNNWKTINMRTECSDKVNSLTHKHMKMCHM